MGVAGFMTCMAWIANGSAGIGESMVFLLRITDMRRRPFLILVYDDLLEVAEWRDDAADVSETVAKDEALVGRCSLELSEGGCVEWELREGGG